MDKHDEKILEAGKVLAKAGVISMNPYSGAKGYGDPLIYRMRLFLPDERSVLRKGLSLPGSGWECIPGGSGMMDELEMVNFEAHGKTLDQVKRTIGR